MTILSQFPCSSVSSVRLLPAPPLRLALPSPRRVELLAEPRIAGLLTAGATPQRSPHQDYLVFEKRLTWEEVQTQLICPTLEEMDDEIDAIITHYRERKQGIRDAHASRQRVSWAGPTWAGPTSAGPTSKVGPTSKSEGV